MRISIALHTHERI